MSAANSIKTFITPHLDGWRIQFGRWTDGPKTDRYAVIRPIGGAGASLVRRPSFSILLIGAAGDAIALPSMAAESIIEAMRTQSGDLVSMQAGEAVYLATDDGRHTFEFSVTTITN